MENGGAVDTAEKLQEPVYLSRLIQLGVVRWPFSFPSSSVLVSDVPLGDNSTEVSQ
jgi:hypothetical protein